MSLKKSKKTKKLFVAQIKTELVVAAYSEDEAMAVINDHYESSIEKYTLDEPKAEQGWGLHLNELTQLEQLQDTDNANIVPFNSEQLKTVEEFLAQRKTSLK